MGWLRSVAYRGGVEALLGLVLGAMAIVFHLNVGVLGWPLVLDLTICWAAALSGRLPTVASTAVIGLLALLAVTHGIRSVGELAALIPVLGLGLRNNRRGRLAYSIAAYLTLMGGALPAARGMSIFVPLTFWLAAITIMWILGDAFTRMRHNQAEQRRQALRDQRISLARELHDTIAHDLTRIALHAEAALLTGSQEPTGWETVALMSRSGLKDLRSVIELLRDPEAATATHDTTSFTVEEVVQEAELRIRDAGFRVQHERTEDAKALNTTRSPSLRSITREAVNNIIHHAEPGTDVVVHASIEGGFAELALNNRRRAQGERGTGLGLVGMSERAAVSGGHVSSRPRASQWVTQISAPTNDQDTE